MMYHIRESTSLSKSIIWCPSSPDILLAPLWFSPTIRPHCPTPRTVLTIAYSPLRTRSNSNGHDFEVDFEYEPEPEWRANGTDEQGAAMSEMGSGVEALAAERGVRSSGDAGCEATVCTKRAPSLSPAATARPRREASSYRISPSSSSLLHPRNSSTAPLRNRLPLAMAAVEPAGKNVPLQITEGANPTANVQRAVRNAARR